MMCNLVIIVLCRTGKCTLIRMGRIAQVFKSNYAGSPMCAQNKRLRSLIGSEEILGFEDKCVIIVLFYTVQIWLLLGL